MKNSLKLICLSFLLLFVGCASPNKIIGLGGRIIPHNFG